MSAFDTAMQALFADGNLGVAATYLPLQGTNKSVRVITKAPDVYQQVGQSNIETPSFVLEVQVVDCPALVQGDRFQIGANIYTVQGEPRKDSVGLTWEVDCYAS